MLIDLRNAPFVAYQSYEQDVSSLSNLLDIHAPLKIRHLPKPAPSWITNGFQTAKCL